MADQRVCFDRADLEAFAAASHDRNPLHLDARYARRTPFGQPVVHGVAAVLRVLGLWAQGRPLRLIELSAAFLRPLFPDVEYQLGIDADGTGRVRATLLRDRAALVRLSFSVESAGGADHAPHAPAAPFAPLTAPREAPVLEQTLTDLAYRPAQPALASLLARTSIAPGQLPPQQIRTLLWSSYFVGMELPGRQALFSELEIRFGREQARPAPGPLIAALRSSCDARFNRVRIDAEGPGVERLRLVAFVRPPPVEYPLAAIRAALDAQGDAARSSFAGRTVLVTGSSRGFGAVLGKVLALRGAAVIFHARDATEEVARTLHELGAAGIRAASVQADLGHEESCRALAERVQREHGGLDALICAAAPVIGERLFVEQPSEEFVAFVQQSLHLYAGPIRHFLPSLREGAAVVAVSSVIVAAPRPRFSHYAAAKAAIEGMMGALATERRDVRFVVARPARMRTDQQSLAYDLAPPPSAIPAAIELCARLSALPETPGLHVLELQEEAANVRPAR